MIFSIITIFPESFDSYLNSSILKRAQKRGLIKISFLNPRDFVKDKHKTVDDKPFGGGPGMVMKAEPILKAVQTTRHRISSNSKVILLSARGRQFTQKMARDWAKKYKNIILISGHYEGIDERVKKILKAEEISVGDYILTGGELPAMVIVDAISRHIAGVLGKAESLEEKQGSHQTYTRPEIIKYRGKKYAVPKVLISGNHKNIEEWRKKY
ncbi:MAG: tRNA (guanosine(37)-N1)-methyltransferase TrmD [Candidatus Niyogibacteria bacterium RIFCSPLOWO2_01_FULL_45_48]|uniref:tRNA (guanine-N(1)-)-methyltransferase n=2 Tax=Candidatus Niyogiibacteriota TaxID=1817912 RepID=A0A1G2EY50_9BACT|nr:MAG: tRNA (guanosine(37)-N1)-methyltransferase TrmD [Candidatus Niyogibacteria bacterium RIFCSPHIGHO2_01_FULL_45_28]OGZ29330.1 MAG: tRNA (guanosine(37)-N1)-methyltransferase TrmD [Candidatus Niyogibacteria bacterium RIFCSPLOWO2_01_FULL_45_48]OGZ30725.1 MAG: tRNA (guanosine(37)-N1)-methyltransferase TrmD [Candidatus Niyogibacteria bacterium RIFCSPLOWO2_02_FULL_45_13]